MFGIAASYAVCSKHIKQLGGCKIRKFFMNF